MRKIHVRAFGPPGLFTPEAFFELLAGLDADLTVDVVEMGFDSAQRNAHGAGDVLIVLAFEEETQDLGLALGEPVIFGKAGQGVVQLHGRHLVELGFGGHAVAQGEALAGFADAEDPEEQRQKVLRDAALAYVREQVLVAGACG